MSRHSTYLLPLCLILFGGSAVALGKAKELAEQVGTPATRVRAPTIAAPARPSSFADAPYLTPKNFLAAVTDVSVAVHAPAETTRYVPESELQTDVADALRTHGISVRADSPVRVDVRVFQKDSTFFRNGDRNDHQDVHDIVVILSFTTRGVVRRGTRLYPIVASPVEVKGVNSVFQNNETRRAFYGDETKADMQKVFPRMLLDLLKTLETNDAVDSTPWYGATWTDAQKAAANAEFVSLMRAPVPETGHFANLDVMPTVTSETISDVDGCRMPSRYADEWRKAFRDVGWTKTAADAPRLEHSFRCDAMNYINTPKYTRIWNSIDLKEPNFVFVLNGQTVRKLAVIHFWSGLLVAANGNAVADALDRLFGAVEMDTEELRIPAPASPGPR